MALGRGALMAAGAAAALALAAASPALAQADLAVTATGSCGQCAAGQRVSVVSTVTDLGPDNDPAVELQMVLPALGSAPVDWSWTTTQGEFETDPDSGSQVFYDPAALCYFWFIHVGGVTVGQTVTVAYQADLDPVPPQVADFHVDSPAAIAGPKENTPASGWGQPWPDWGVVDVPIQLAEDGSGNYQGCSALQGFVAGRIAYLDRGACEFGLKALNAEAAGAAAVVIANNAAGAGTVPMGPGQFGDAVTVPVTMITYEDGVVFKDYLTNLGQQVNASFTTVPIAGPGQTWDVSSEGTGYPSLWAYNTTNDPDCPSNDNCPPAGMETDNIVYLHLLVDPGGVFSDNLDIGSTSGWSSTAD